MHKNIFLVGSPWHLLVALAISKHHEGEALFLLERISDSSFEAMEDLCKSQCVDYKFSGDIESLMLDKVDLKKPFFEQNRLKRTINYIEEVNKFLAHIPSKTIYYFNYYSPVTRATLRQLDSAEFIRVEDGICDYFPFRFKYHNPIKLLLRNLLVELLPYKYIYTRSSVHLNQNTTSFMVFFPNLVDTQFNVKGLNAYIPEMRRIISESYRQYFPNLLEKEKRLLIIGQTLFEDGMCTLEDETLLYEHAAKSFAGDVIFKPHPRSTIEKLEKIKSIESIDIFDEPIMAEALMVKNQFSDIAGLWSNSVIYARKLFCIESYTLLSKDEVNKINSMHIRKIDNFLRENMADNYIPYNPKHTC